ncbi:MAG: 50S ribosomal protein L29 [Synergistetes bacterium]|nr:50S ribosomal protein L29 [Synergistota bacterium]
MKAAELRDLTINELKLKLRDLKQEFLNLRFQNSIGQLNNPRRIREVRKDVARILTIIREKELGGE